MKTHAVSKILLSEFQEVLREVESTVRVAPLGNFDSNQDKADIYIEDSLSPKDVVKAVLDKDIHHLIQINPNYFATDIKSAAPLAKHPENYFKEDYLVIEGDSAKSLKIQINSPDEKKSVLSTVLAFIDTLKSSMVKQAATAVIEELYMNAILDAPKEAALRGNNKQAQGPILFIAHNATHLQISCTDHYGSMELKKFVARVHEVYDKGAGESIRFEGDGGAGIGGYLLFENCSTLVVGVKPDQATKVTALIPLKVSHRVLCGMKKSIHGFVV